MNEFQFLCNAQCNIFVTGSIGSSLLHQIICNEQDSRKYYMRIPVWSISNKQILKIIATKLMRKIRGSTE